MPMKPVLLPVSSNLALQFEWLMIFAVDFGFFQIIDPAGRHDLHNGGVVEAIENCDLFCLLFLWCFAATAALGVLDQLHGAHVIELTMPGFRIREDHSLRQFRM